MNPENPLREREWVERSSLYREYAAEREEILKHKWFESQRAGRDIGFESALVGWLVHHRAEWRQARRAGKSGGMLKAVVQYEA